MKYWFIVYQFRCHAITDKWSVCNGVYHGIHPLGFLAELQKARDAVAKVNPGDVHASEKHAILWWSPIPKRVYNQWKDQLS